MERFRPNIVVDGCKPFDEDRWESIRFHLQDQCYPIVVENSTGSIDYIDMTVVKPCARCMVPNVDPVKGEMEAGKPISAALKLIRSGEIIGFNVSKWKKEVRNRSGTTYTHYIEVNGDIIASHLISVLCSCSSDRIWTTSLVVIVVLLVVVLAVWGR